MSTRQEADSIGPVAIPGDRYWGAQTARALMHFPQVGPLMPIPILRAFGLQKAAAARANAALGALTTDLAKLIEGAALELAEGQFDAHFPLSVWQTGSGTQTNMCANEVIANRANERAGMALGARSPVHPNDHVNRSQSSNDSFPTVMHVAALCETEARLLPAIEVLAAAVAQQEASSTGIVRLARTHLNDSVPVPLAQMYQSWGASLAACRDHIVQACKGLRRLPQGGTAAGSGLNAPPGFAERVCCELTQLSGTDFAPHPVKVEGMAAHDALAAHSAALRGCALAVARMANDIRHLASGPRAGLGELILPEDGLSSSIMPGKRNATQAEAFCMVAHRIIGNDATVTSANASSLFELNVAKPVIALAVLESIDLLTEALPRFACCMAGLRPDHVRMEANAEMSLMLATALTPRLGYDRTAQIVRTAETEGLSIREAAGALVLMDHDEFDRLAAPRRMAGLGEEGLA